MKYRILKREDGKFLIQCKYSIFPIWFFAEMYGFGPPLEFDSLEDSRNTIKRWVKKKGDVAFQVVETFK